MFGHKTEKSVFGVGFCEQMTAFRQRSLIVSLKLAVLIGSKWSGGLVKLAKSIGKS